MKCTGVHLRDDPELTLSLQTKWFSLHYYFDNVLSACKTDYLDFIIERNRFTSIYLVLFANGRPNLNKIITKQWT